MTTLTVQQLQDAAPQLRKTIQSRLNKHARIGVRTLIVSSTEFMLIVRYMPSPFVELEARFSITSDGCVEKLPSAHLQKDYSFPNKFSWGGFPVHAVERWVDDILLTKRLEQSKRFCAQIKRELVEKVWHPERVAKWLEAGIQLEEL